MHELSIAQALVEQVQKIARESGADKINRITLRIGKLAGVDPDALSFAFPLAAEGTCLQNTPLEFISVEPDLRCRACGKSNEAEFVSACVHCGSQDLELKHGRELLIESVELEVPE
jgi:hydrogenase nickel incorporation protein HypA/HybF